MNGQHSTVHLKRPTSLLQNGRLDFSDYIMNLARKRFSKIIRTHC